MCASNLHQCGISLRIYMDDYGTNVPPDDQTARRLLDKMPTVCPNDTEWTQKGTKVFGPPLIGSYAYVRSLLDLNNPDPLLLPSYFDSGVVDIMMVDIFHSSYGITAPYYTEKESLDQYYQRIHSEQWQRQSFPNNIIQLYTDGHLHITKPSETPVSREGHISLFAWDPILLTPYRPVRR